jgi:hypothetical protein
VARNLTKNDFNNNKKMAKQKVPVLSEPVRLKVRMFYGRYETTLKEVTTNIPLPSATNFNNIQSLGREKKSPATKS